MLWLWLELLKICMQLVPSDFTARFECHWSRINLKFTEFGKRWHNLKKKEDAEEMCFDMSELYYLNLFLTYLHILWINQVIFALETTLNETQENDILRHFFRFGNIITLVKIESKRCSKCSKYGTEISVRSFLVQNKCNTCILFSTSVISCLRKIISISNKFTLCIYFTTENADFVLVILSFQKKLRLKQVTNISVI